MRVVEFESFHLAPNTGAVAFIKIQQFQQFAVAGCFHISLYKMLCQLRMPVKIQVHSQESDFAGYVDVSESVVEFDAIIDAETVNEANVGSVQVSVAVSYPAFFHSLGE